MAYKIKMDLWIFFLVYLIYNVAGENLIFYEKDAGSQDETQSLPIILPYQSGHGFISKDEGETPKLSAKPIDKNSYLKLFQLMRHYNENKNFPYQDTQIQNENEYDERMWRKLRKIKKSSPAPNDEDKRSAIFRSMGRRSQNFNNQLLIEEFLKTRGAYIPAISVGALMNLRGFFTELENNLASLEAKALNSNQLKFMEGENLTTIPPRKEYIDDTPLLKPSGSAAFLNAIRNYRPNHKIRSLIAMQPEIYRGSNNYNPSLLWTGLG